jgi:translation initiation factor 2 beta subunit (eIF-2beta)/eIF-5
MEQHGKLYLTSDADVLFDTNYRYVIKQLVITHAAKKGTQITILENIDVFCKELLFDKEVIAKIIGKNMSCKCSVDKSTGKYYLQGNFMESQIKNVVYDFIQKNLLCVACDKPEVNLKYKKEKIKQQCRACGNNAYLDNCQEEIIKIFKKA